jgi:hypothetical protein
MQVKFVYGFFARKLHEEQNGSKKEDRFRLLTNKEVDRWMRAFQKDSFEEIVEDEDEN